MVLYNLWGLILLLQNSMRVLPGCFLLDLLLIKRHIPWHSSPWQGFVHPLGQPQMRGTQPNTTGMITSVFELIKKLNHLNILRPNQNHQILQK